MSAIEHSFASKVTKRRPSPSGSSSFNTAKSRQRRVRHRDGRPTPLPRGYPIPFRLSPSYRHREHKDDCFINHLSDAILTHRLQEELAQKLEAIRHEEICKQRSVATTSALITSAQVRPELNEFGAEIESMKATRDKHLCGLQEIFVQEDAVTAQLEAVDNRLSRLMTAVFDSAQPFCNQVAFEERTSDLPISDESDIHGALFLAEHFTRQLGQAVKESETLKKAYLDAQLSTAPKEESRESFRARMFANRQMLLRRRLVQDSWRTLLREEATPILRGKLDVTYLFTEENLKTLQSQLVGTDVGVEDESLSSRSSHDTDGRPSRHRPGLIEMDAANVMSRPHQTWPKLVPTHHLAWDIFYFEQLAQSTQRELHDIRFNYMRSLNEHLCEFPLSNREQHDINLEEEADEEEETYVPFVESESQAMAKLHEAQLQLEAARSTMRKQIASMPQPSEPSLADRTSDANTTSTAPALMEERAPFGPSPESIRRWHAKVAREVNALDEQTREAQHRELVRKADGRRRSGSASPPSDQEREDDTPEHWERKQRWKMKARWLGLKPDTGRAGRLTDAVTA